MKRIIAAALSILVGAFGYTIVDSAIEDRVATLESEVVELREEVSRYHPENDSSVTTKTTTLHTYEPTTGAIPLEVGDYLSESSNSMHKFMLRKYSNGRVDYISPVILNNGATQPWVNYNLPMDTITAVSDVLFNPTDSRLTTSATTKMQSSTTAPFTTAFTPIDSTDSKITTTITEVITYEDFFLYVVESSAQVTAIDTDVSYNYWYDNDYSQVSFPIEKTQTTITVVCKGYTDPVFAGKKIRFTPSGAYDTDQYISNTINSDGTFEYKSTYILNRKLYSYNTFSLGSLYID